MEGLDITLSPEDFKLIRDLIDKHSGIRLPDSTHYLVERRLRPRLLALEFEGFREYYRHLKYGRETEVELAEIIERITTNETYFFRHIPQPIFPQSFKTIKGMKSNFVKLIIYTPRNHFILVIKHITIILDLIVHLNKTVSFPHTKF